MSFQTKHQNDLKKSSTPGLVVCLCVLSLLLPACAFGLSCTHVHFIDVSFVDYFNPLRYSKNPQTYINFWTKLFHTLLRGFWARAIAVTSFGLAFWFALYEKRLGISAVFFLISLFVTYAYGVLHLIGLL